MAQLPTRDSLGPTPSARSGRKIVRLDSSAYTRGVQNLARADRSGGARGLADLGQGLDQLGGAIDKYQNTVDPVQEFETERRFQEFKWNQEQDLDQSMRSVQPGQAAGFADQWTKGYTERAREFFGTVPEPLKAKYDNRIFDAERQFFGAAAQFSRNEQKRSSVADIEELTNTAYLSRARAGEPLDAIGADFKDLVGANKFLTPIEKDVEVRKGFGNLEEAHIQGRIDRGDDINEILRDIRGLKSKEQSKADSEAQSEISRADTDRASISTRLETGTDDPLQGVANISRDSGGTKSYGNFGLNSGGSVQEFVKQYGDKFDLTAKPGTKSFDDQWRNAASAAGVELHEAEMEWYRAHTSDVGQKLTNAGVPKELAEDARVQAYFSDRLIQQGPASIDVMKKHAKRISAAAAEADGDPVAFLKNITEADRAALPNDFPTALRTGVYSDRGHDTRLNGRLNLSLGISEAGRAQLPEYGGPYQNLSPKRRLELENKVRTAFSEKTQQDLRNSIEQIRRTGAPPTDEQGQTALDRAARVLTKNQVEKFQLDWIESALEFNSLHDLNTLSESDLQGRLQEIAPSPGEELYQIKAKVFDEAVRRVEKLRELRDKDPASSISDFPEVMDATKLVRENPEEPEAIQTLAKARMDAQAKIGIPEGLQTPITKAEARVIMAPIKGLEGTALRENMISILEGLQGQYGPYARAAGISAIDYAVRNKEIAEQVEGLLTKSMRGLPPKASEVRRLQFLEEADQATKAFGGDFTGEPMLQFGQKLTPTQTAPSAVEGDPFTQYGIKRPPQRAIEALIANPSLASEFDAYYGAGSSAQYLAAPAEKR